MVATKRIPLWSARRASSGGSRARSRAGASASSSFRTALSRFPNIESCAAHVSHCHSPALSQNTRTRGNGHSEMKAHLEEGGAAGLGGDEAAAVGVAVLEEQHVAAVPLVHQAVLRVRRPRPVLARTACSCSCSCCVLRPRQLQLGRAEDDLRLRQPLPVHAHHVQLS